MNTPAYTAKDKSRHVVSSLMHRLLQQKLPAMRDLNFTLHQTLQRLNDTLGAQLTALFLSGSLPQDLKNHAVAVALDPLDDPALHQQKLKIAADWENNPACMDDGCACGVALRGKQRVLITNAANVRLCHASLLERLSIIPATAAIAPIHTRLGLDGCIVCINKGGIAGGHTRPFTDEDGSLLDDTAHYTGLLIDRCKDPSTPLDAVELASIIARLFRVELIRIGPDAILDSTLVHEFNADHLRRYAVLPVKRLGPRAIRAILAHPEDFQNAGEFEIATGQHIEEKQVAPAQEIFDALKRIVPSQSRILEVADILSRELPASNQEDGYLEEQADENSASIINLSRQIIEEAFDQRASDVHVEPFEDKLLIRYRIDGICREKLSLPRAVHRALVSRLKIMSDLDIAEHRLPQDGRIVFKRFSPKYDLDLRVSVVPANYGESVVMRILDKKKSLLPLNQLGYSEYNLGLYRELIQAPYGMILHCGPTGSGKSMTMFAALNEINSPELKILTAEDPIEYTIPRIIQLQMKRDIGLTFASTLRSFLRQDPDIILVGEVRDLETAEIAVEAALTGHLLFSTLHTNDAASTVTRLIDIGIEPFLLSSTLLGICAQRLLRRLCKCKKTHTPDATELKLFKQTRQSAIPQIFEATGCPHCENSGYRGRVGIHELMRINEPLRAAIASKKNEDEIKAQARKQGMHTLFEDAMEKVDAGTTSIREALATARDDGE